jgi:hypothetical protein
VKASPRNSQDYAKSSGGAVIGGITLVDLVQARPKQQAGEKALASIFRQDLPSCLSGFLSMQVTGREGQHVGVFSGCLLLDKCQILKSTLSWIVYRDVESKAKYLT